MTSTSRVQANRENAKRSTGPKTPEGKAASSKNATTHGLSSTFRVLAHEDAAAFAALNDELKAEFKPATTHQKFLVEQMAQNRWRLERTRRYESIALEQLLGEIDETNPEAVIVSNMSRKVANIFDLLRRYANDAERSYFKAHAALVKDLETARQNKANDVADYWYGRLAEAKAAYPEATPPQEPRTAPGNFGSTSSSPRRR